MQRAFGISLTIINLTIFCILGYQAFYGNVISDDGLSRADFASILLTASAVILTGVAVMMAVLAIWGYNEIKKAATNAARDAGKAAAKEVARNEAQTVALKTARETMNDAIGDGDLAAAMWEGGDNVDNDHR